MVSFIQTIIEKFGGRVAGTDAEKQAQHYVEGVLDSYCDSVEWHGFSSALNSKFHSLKGFCITFMLAIVLFSWNVYVAAAVAAVNAILFFGHFLAYQDWLDFLYKKQTSSNVIGKIEPSGPVRSTIIVSGHIDSVREFQWWYRLKHFGGVLTTISGFLIVIQAPTYVAAAIAHSISGMIPEIFTWFLWSHIILTPVLITFFTIHGSRKVDGALDNLTGVALAVEMAKVFGGPERLKHTRLKVISFGSEETGLKGARHYVNDHLQELKDEKASIINIDTIKSDEHLSIVRRELNPMTKYSDDMISKAELAFQEEEINYKVINMPVGATDGTAFARKGLKAVSIIGLTTKKFDPTYHTRLDNLSNLDPKGLEAMKRMLVRFINNWDEAS